MVFNSIDFAGFFVVVLCVFYALNRYATLAVRNAMLLLASYYFYGQFAWWFPLLVVYVTAVNYLCGYWISKSREQGRGKLAVTATLVLSLLPLAFFKYAYFVWPSILLPVGLSFFTFQALTYTLDLYRGKIGVCRDLLTFALFVAFFPTLLCGPIERARNILPQFNQRVPFDPGGIAEGLGVFVWGLFKKVVIADRLAIYVNEIYYTPMAHSGSTLALAAVFYGFQIYCDFSGYADMATGVGRMLGFDIMRNFNLPYCASTIKEFWRRWNISLTSWFTEYVYISMGGNRVSRLRWMLNICTIFLLSGVWHGATWSFIVWGGIHAAFYLAEHFMGIKKPNVLYHLLTFVMVTFAWVFFRIEDISMAWDVVSRICTDMISPIYWGSSTFTTLISMALLIVFVVREHLTYIGKMTSRPALEYVGLVILICLFGVSSSQFVYFQF